MDPTGLKRRLTCILATDAVGYSRLVNEDETGALRVLAAHRAVIDGIIAYHEGRIANTAGDSVLAEFGSVVEGVRCAVEIQDALKTRNESLPEPQRMLFRIGINLGEVVVKGDDLLGDGVNVAARLQSIAPPGGILVSSSVYDQITGKLDLGFQDMGDQALKNISRPIRAFRVAGAGESPRPAPARPAAPSGPTPPRRLGPAAIVAIVAIAAVAVLAVTQGWFKPLSRDDGAKAKLEAELAAAQQARAQAEAAAVKARAETEAAQLKAKAESEAAATKAKAQADAAALRSKAAADASPPKPTSPPAAPPPAQLASAAPPPSPTRPHVDGAWTVLQHCSAVGNAPPFQRAGETVVVDGEFVLERGKPGEPGYQRLRGKPTPDGALTLTGTAISALPRNLGETFDVRYEGLWTGDRFELRGKFGNRTCRIELARK